MCRSCDRDMDLLWALGFGRGRGGGGGSHFGYDGDVDRSGFAPVSARAMGALEDAKRVFLNHLATVDTSKGAVTTEIIKFHLVTDMRKSFNKFVKEYGCTGSSRQITRAEQDLVNKSRKSLLHYTSVKVTPQAQQEYLAKNPQKAAAAHSASANAAAGGSSSSVSASASTSASASGPLRDISTQKIKNKLNEAAVAHAASNSTVKKLSHKNKA